MSTEEIEGTDDTVAIGLERARHLIELRRYTEALDELGSVLAVDPESVEALCLRGQCLVGVEDAAGACATAEIALNLAPDDEWPHRIRAVALGLLKRYREALDEAYEVVRLDPHDAGAYTLLAEALLDVKEADQAGAAAEQALELGPEWPRAHVVAGNVARERGDEAAARQAYHRALELDPEDTRALGELAGLDAESLNFEGVPVSHGTAALALDPHDEGLRDRLETAAINMLLMHVALFVLVTPALWLLAGAELASFLDVWWPRALVGLGCVSVWAFIVGRWLRALPKGARRYLREVRRKFEPTDVARFWWLEVPVWPLFLATALLPAPVALATGPALEILFVAARSGWLPGLGPQERD